MNKNKDILLDILEKNWEPEQIYNMFPNPSPWKNEIEQEKTGYCWLITELHAFCTLWRSQMRFRAVALRSITAARF